MCDQEFNEKLENNALENTLTFQNRKPRDDNGYIKGKIVKRKHLWTEVFDG